MGWMGLFDEEGNQIGTVGDEPWDIMGEALDRIKKLYLEKFGREPYAEEIDQIFDFVSGGYKPAPKE